MASLIRHRIPQRILPKSSGRANSAWRGAAGVGSALYTAPAQTYDAYKWGGKQRRYRAKAAELRAEAVRETDPIIRSSNETLAASYENLAEQLEKIEAEGANPSPVSNDGEKN
jgi:hypothetical protein